MAEVSEKVYEEKAEAKLTPIERVMTTARYEIMSHEDDLVKAGVTVDQLKSASRIAEDRVQTEFKEKEAEDPIRRFVGVLHDVAQTDEEKGYAKQMERELETKRAELAKVIKTEEKRAKKQNTPFDLKSTINNLFLNRELPVQGNFRGNYDDGIRLTLLENWVPNPDNALSNGRYGLTPEYTTRVLRSIGSIEKDEKLDDLRLLTPMVERTDYKTPYYEKGAFRERASNIPTFVENVVCDIDLDDNITTLVIKDIKDVQKIVDFPTS